MMKRARHRDAALCRHLLEAVEQRVHFSATPTLISVIPNGGSPQRSAVSAFTLTFDQTVTLATGAVRLDLLNTGGSGRNDDSGPADVSSALAAPTTTDGGKTWAFTNVAGNSFVQNGSLADGIYRLNIEPSKVTANGVAMSAAPTPFAFHRLFGDINGDAAVNALDYVKFRQSFGKSAGDASYEAALDFNNDGTVNPLDYAQFRGRFGKTFTDPPPSPPAFPPGTISGSVFNDLNNNNGPDPGEPGIITSRIYLDNGDGIAGLGDRVFYTDKDGKFSISGLSPGTYTLIHVANNGYFQISPPGGSVTIQLPADGGVGNIDFADSNQLLGHFGVVTGLVFNDLNGNGSWQAGEPGLGGRIVFIDLDNDGRQDADEPAAVSDALGQYTINQVPSGPSQIVEVVPVGWAATTDPTQTLNLLPNLTLFRNFGTRPLSG